ERRVAVPVHVATEAEYRRRGVFWQLQRRDEEQAAAAGAPLTITFPNAASHRIFVHDLGWRDLPGRRFWARPLRALSVFRYLAGRPSGAGGLRTPTPGSVQSGPVRIEPLARFPAEAEQVWRTSGLDNEFVRDAAFLNWRYVDSPRDYRCFGAYRGEALTGFA